MFNPFFPLIFVLPVLFLQKETLQLIEFWIKSLIFFLEILRFSSFVICDPLKVIKKHKIFEKSYAKLSDKLKTKVKEALLLFDIDKFDKKLNNH